MSAGGDHTCGLTNNGVAYCWGGDAAQQTLKPTLVPGGLHFTQMSAGDQHTCAVTADFQAYCWGENVRGQLGDGTFENRSVPTLVRESISSVRSGPAICTCAVNVNHAAFCWGDNEYGMLGTGGSQTRVPTLVLGGLQWRQVIAGASHTCGVTTDNKGYCWGANFFGELGDGTRTERHQPTAIAGGLAFQQVSPRAGWYPSDVEPFVDDGYSCGVTTDNKAYCWGLNQEGDLGTGMARTASRRRKLPVAGGFVLSTPAESTPAELRCPTRCSAGVGTSTDSWATAAAWISTRTPHRFGSPAISASMR